MSTTAQLRDSVRLPADTVIASTVESDGDPERAHHWLLDARTLGIRGTVAYPTGPVDRMRHGPTH
ncbi:hypothetical protein [Streptomyces xantholiticus]|uniref:Uncharacterized protein n=1 Tax=Streptomyces xantholiticus TaxID=68285 RepID=A0ABV1V077_9ACTN